jgi:predicted DNA-binding protein YlxM (UPF0122 family)
MIVKAFPLHYRNGQIDYLGESAMSKNLEVAILLDFYGEMLTEKQRDLIDLYYNEDLSLGEIAQLQQITRQGVRDSIKRGEDFLYELEEKLKLYQNYRETQKTFQMIRDLAAEIYQISDRYKYSVDVIRDSNQILQIAQQHLD